jgi:hypothetical protein
MIITFFRHNAKNYNLYMFLKLCSLSWQILNYKGMIILGITAALEIIRLLQNQMFRKSVLNFL